MSEPLKPIWQVVHREVLVDLLGAALTEACGVDSNPERCQHIEQLHGQAEAGTLPVLTKERWEGTE